MSDVKTGDKPSAEVYRLFKGDGPTRQTMQKFISPQLPDPVGGAVMPNAFEPEDEYQLLYIGAARDKGILQPPYSLRLLDALALENNALSPCIEAMVTNVDGTGYDFESVDEEKDDAGDDANIDALNEFFNEPWPGMSFKSVRELLRRDLKRTGNAYLEVLRNAQDKVVFVRHVDAKMMRILKLDDPIPVTKNIMRDGVMQKITLMSRERRYTQLVNGISLVYFKDFGVGRDLHKASGYWSPEGQRLAAKDRASEIIHFTDMPDAHTPYGVPCWIGQLPSVLGSRKAEEFNLDFFDNGGVPPALIVLQGGTLQTETRKALEQRMFGPAHTKQRVAILEVEPNGGSMEHPSQAKVTVERFGAERTSDSMFEKYDERCELRVRRSFRLPPIFVGQSTDYSFATAYVSYNVTEAQVFKPERDKFDEIITMKLLADMGYRGYKMVSNPLTIEDVTMKLQGIELAGTLEVVQPDDLLDAVNDACGLSLKLDQARLDVANKNALNPQVGSQTTVGPDGTVIQMPVSANDLANVGGGPNNANVDGQGVVKKPPTKGKGGKPGQPPSGGTKPGQSAAGTKGTTPSSSTGGKPAPVKKGADGEPVTVLGLARDTMHALRKRDFVSLGDHLRLVQSFDAHGRREFQKAAASLQFIDPEQDHEGLGELIACTMVAMNHQHAN